MHGFYSAAIVNVGSQSLRILLAPSAYYPNVGGIEELTRQLAIALRSKGHESAVLTNRWPPATARAEKLNGVDVARLRFPLPAASPSDAALFALTAPLAAASVVRAIRSWRPDVVHAIGAGPQAAYVAVLRPLLRARLVFTAQGELTFDAQDVFARSTSLRGGLRRILRAADAVTACSAYVLRDLTDFAAIRGPSWVVPNGVEPADFAQARPESRERPYVLAVGRLVPQKGLDVLIEAFATSALADLDLVIAGDGPERERLRERAAQLRLAQRVHLAGAVDRAGIASLLAGARAFALPSRGEPFGIALLEAMAAGVPAVATRAGGVPEFARDGENALLVRVDDPQELAAALDRVDMNAEVREALVRGGRATADELRWERIARRYLQIYAAAGVAPRARGIESPIDRRPFGWRPSR